LNCLLDDGFYCPDGTKNEATSRCVAPGSKCPKTKYKNGADVAPVESVKAFKSCGAKYFTNDFKRYSITPYFEGFTKKKVGIPATVTDTWVRNCKNVELPFNKNAWKTLASKNTLEKAD